MSALCARTICHYGLSLHFIFMADKRFERTGLLNRGWEETQIKTFTRWCAKYLKQRGIQFDNIIEDFKNGVKLITLLEIIGKCQFKQKWHKQPKNRFQYLENVEFALDYITKDKGIKLTAIHREQIVDGDKKMTLGLIWSVINKFVIEDISIEEMTARDALLIWCKKNTAGYAGVEMKNFSSSWTNGLAWCALINKFRPSQLEYSELNPQSTDKNDWLSNTSRAWEVFKQLGIETLLDPEDCVGPVDDNGFAPDEKSIITQVTELYHYFSSESKQQAMADKVRRAVQIQKQIDDFKSKYEEEAAETIRLIESAQYMLTAQDYEKTVLGVRGKLSQAIQYTRDQRPEIVDKRASALRLWGALVTKCKTTGRVIPPVQPGLEPEALTARFQELERTSETRRQELTAELKELEQALINAFDARCQTIVDSAHSIRGRADVLTGGLEEQLATLEGMLHEALIEEGNGNQLAGPNNELVELQLNTRAKYTMFQVQTETELLVTHLKHLIEQNKGAQFEAANQARIAYYNSLAAPLLQEAQDFDASVSEVHGTLEERRTSLISMQSELNEKRNRADQTLRPVFQDLENDGIHLDIANTPGKINGVYGGILNRIVEALHVIYNEMVSRFDAHTTQIIEKCRSVSHMADNAGGSPYEIRDQYIALIGQGQQIEPEVAPLTPEFEELQEFHLNFKAKFTPSDVHSEYEQMIAHLRHLLQSKEGEIALNERTTRINNYNEHAVAFSSASQQLEKAIEEIAEHNCEMEAKRNEYEVMRSKVFEFDNGIESLVPLYEDLERDQMHLEIEHSPASIKAFIKGLESHVVTLMQELDQAIAAAKGLAISEEQLAEFRETFSFFDKGGNNRLEAFQLEACLTALGEPVKENECKEVIEHYTGGNSGIDFDNYVRFMLDRFSKVETAQSTKEAFLALSQDNPSISNEQIDRWFEPNDASYLKQQLPQTDIGYDFVPWVDKIYSVPQ